MRHWGVELGITTGIQGMGWRVSMTLCLLLACWPVAAEDWVYRVRPGDTLWDLSGVYLKPGISWQRLQEHNRITDPQQLPPGTRLLVPLAWLQSQPAQARVIALEGSATVLAGGQGAAQDVVMGMTLGVGSVLRTSSGGSLSLEFADGSRLRLRERSELVLDRLSRYGRSGMVDTRLRLQQGRIDNEVHKLRGPGAQFIVDTPTASSAVRGTHFRVQASADASRAEVLDGKVGVQAGDHSTMLRPGFGALARRDGGPLQAVALLPAPDLSALASHAPNDLRLHWSSVAQANGYRVQLSQQADFASLAIDQVTPTPKLTLPSLPPGQYHLQVRAIDAAGLEGHDTTVALLLDGQPEPPFVMAPNAGAVVRKIRPRLQWTRSMGAASYQYDVSRDADFSSSLVSGTSRGDAATVAQDLAPGAYYWRVRSIDAQGKKGPFGDAIPFTIRPLEPVGDIDRGQSSSSGAIVFRWRATQPDQHYRFQMSRTPAFTDLRVDETVDRPEVRLDKLPSGTWYLRAQALDSNGEAGPFAEPQQIHIPCRLCRMGAGAALIVLLLSL